MLPYIITEFIHNIILTVTKLDGDPIKAVRLKIT